MNIIIKTKNLESTEWLEKFINEKIGKLEKFLSADNQEIFIEIEKASQHHKSGDVFFAEAILVVPGKKIMAKAKEDDLAKAITEVKKELEIEVKKYKLKKIEMPRREAKKSRKQIF